MKQKYTVIHMVPVGFYAGQYIAAMKRIETADLAKYLNRRNLDATHVFEGWPKLQGQNTKPKDTP